MANYITHIAMGEVISIPKRINIEKKSLELFSLGQDLMSITSKLNYNTHNSLTHTFFKSLIYYIKQNKLYENEEIIAYLYGHIMHYELDKHTHPYIYYITNDVPKFGIVNFHMALEEYLGNIVLDSKLTLSRKQIFDKCKEVKPNKNKVLEELVNKIYLETYNYKNSFNIFKTTLESFKLLNSFRDVLDKLDQDLYYRLIGLQHYLKEIQLPIENVANMNHDTWYDPITKDKHNSSFIDMFDGSILSSQEIIYEVNKVLYDGSPISTLDSIFDNSSYDTALNCEIGKSFSYSRYKTLIKNTK
ncbi:MAG: zinc dependent phospholipase C family protein [Bacilli bacterium]|nr:zinc dependent phospholipase C family protein [Bacilli bacterium]